MLLETFVWQHNEIQRELDKLVVNTYDDLYDLNRISDQQDKANLLSTDTSIFQLVPTLVKWLCKFNANSM